MSNEDRARFEVILESIETKIGVIADGHLALNEKFDRLEGKVDQLEVKVDHLSGEVALLRSDLGSVKLRVGEIEHRVGEIEHHLGLNGVSKARATKVRKSPRRKPR